MQRRDRRGQQQSRIGCGGGSAGAGPGTAGAGASGVGGAAGSAGAGAAPGLTLDGAPIYSRYVRLTHEQWENSVRDLLQLPALPGLSTTFTSDPPGSNFSNNERRLFMTSGLWSDYETAAETLSQQVARDATALSRVTGGTTVAATFIRNFGRRAYRRDLTAAEETTYGTLFSSGATIFASGNAFADGVQLVIETMLQSPYFIYRTEAAAAGQLLTGYEAASKLSFLLRNTMPDNALLDAAKAGSLNTADGIATQAQIDAGRDAGADRVPALPHRAVRDRSLREHREERDVVPQVQRHRRRGSPHRGRPAVRLRLRAGARVQGSAADAGRVRQPEHGPALRHDRHGDDVQAGDAGRGSPRLLHARGVPRLQRDAGRSRIQFAAASTSSAACSAPRTSRRPRRR